MALETTKALLDLDIPYGHILEVIVVDDASTDQTDTILRANLPTSVKLLRLDKNRGRGGAINYGAKYASGRRLLVLDADCYPLTSDFLKRHLTALARGAQVSVGTLDNPCDDFWNWYQNRAAARRMHQFKAGVVYAMTSANVMFDLQWFRRVGGFDPRYRHYGFEDRDLFLRLHAAGARIACPDAPVVHRDAGLSLDAVCRKMGESGRYSALVFSQAHPIAYQILGLAAIDARLHAWLRPIGRILSPLAVRSARSIDPLLKSSWMPRRIAAAIVRICSGLAYLQGTCARESNKRSP